MGYWLLTMASLALLGWILYQKRLPHRPAASRPAPPSAQETAVTLPTPAPPPETTNAPATATPPASPVPEPTPARNEETSTNDFVPPAPPQVTGFPRPANDVLEAQVRLANQGISCGPIDGVAGSQTAAALEVFQEKVGLPRSGLLTAATRARLILKDEPLQSYIVTEKDVARLQPVSGTWLGKSQQTRLDYETLLELVAERYHASQKFIRRLNPEVDWSVAPPGLTVIVPRVQESLPPGKAAFVRIQLAERVLQVFGDAGKLLAHFPCSIAQKVDKRPVGELHVADVITDPDYTFNPEIFTESAEGRRLGRKLVVPPGPNNPVGVAWIGLDRPGYGIHGTPVPELVGRTESHGCFRLANWDAENLVRLVQRGTPVYVEP